MCSTNQGLHKWRRGHLTYSPTLTPVENGIIQANKHDNTNNSIVIFWNRAIGKSWKGFRIIYGIKQCPSISLMDNFPGQSRLSDAEALMPLKTFPRKSGLVPEPFCTGKESGKAGINGQWLPNLYPRNPPGASYSRNTVSYRAKVQNLLQRLNLTWWRSYIVSCTNEPTCYWVPGLTGDRGREGSKRNRCHIASLLIEAFQISDNL